MYLRFKTSIGTDKTAGEPTMSTKNAIARKIILALPKLDTLTYVCPLVKECFFSF